MFLIGVFSLLFYLFTRCPKNHYRKDNKCIECCTDNSPCLQTKNSKCKSCIKLLFTLKNGICVPNTDEKNITDWLKDARDRLSNPPLASYKEIFQEFYIWVTHLCDPDATINPADYTQAMADLLDLLGPTTTTTNYAKKLNKIISEHGLCDIITFDKQN